MDLRILDIKEIKSVPFVPRSHPFIERLIGTLRREYLDSFGTVPTCIGSWIASPAITTSAVSMLDWAATHPSGDAAEPCANRPISMTSRGSPTVLASSTRQLLRNQQFTIVTLQLQGLRHSNAHSAGEELPARVHWLSAPAPDASVRIGVMGPNVASGHLVTI